MINTKKLNEMVNECSLNIDENFSAFKKEMKKQRENNLKNRKHKDPKHKYDNR